MPAHKKHATARARRNVAATATTLRVVDPEEVAQIVVPPLRPARRPHPSDPETQVGWLTITRDWWQELWRSPMSSEYADADIYQLYALAAIMDNFFRAPTAALAGELRQARAAFGLTPYDRRKLEWTIEEAEDRKDRGARRRREAESRAVPEGPVVDPRFSLGSG